MYSPYASKKAYFPINKVVIHVHHCTSVASVLIIPIKNTPRILSHCLTRLFKVADALSLQFITEWSAEMKNATKYHQNRTNPAEMWPKMEMYLAYGGVQAVSILVGLTALSLGCIWTSSALHNKMLYAVLRAPMSFFDSTPTGRILNRLVSPMPNEDIQR